MTEIVTAGELLDAIRLAESAFGAANASPGDYRLVRVEWLLGSSEECTGVRCWRLSFKLARLIPTQSAARVGAGGELFFTVDLDAGRATLMGRGE
jgi:hypothetical protein